MFDVRLVVEAKRLRNQAFVGFLPDAVDRAKDWSLTRLRANVVGGLPSWGLDRDRKDAEGDLREIAFADGSIVRALDALNVAPRCIQWAVATRGAKAEQPGPMSDDMFGGVRVCTWTAREFTDGLLENRYADLREHRADLYLLIALPLVVVDGPIFTYDTETHTVEPSNWVTLRILTDTIVGTRAASVDVMTLGGLDAFVTQLKIALEQVSRTFLDSPDGMTSLRLIAAAQRKVRQDLPRAPG